MAPSLAEKSPPSSGTPPNSSASTPKPSGEKPSTWRARIRTRSRQWTWPAYRHLLQRSQRPILVGPFLGEVGLETLYWQPFIAKTMADLHLDPARVIPVTRSGAHVWYGCPRAVEIYGMRAVRDVRVENRLRVARTHMLKQMTVSPFDRAILADAAASLQLDRYLTLHPAWMYQTLQDFWNGHRGLEWLEPRVQFAPLSKPDPPCDLPARYVAVSFYGRTTWPPNAITAEFGRGAIHAIAKQLPVVILSTGLHMDDHMDFIPKPLPDNVIVLSDLVTPSVEDSLAVVSAVIGRAQAYVGTYGGLSHLALRYGIPSVNLYTQWAGIMLAHKHLSEALALGAGVPYHVLQLGQVPILQDVLPRVVVQA